MMAFNLWQGPQQKSFFFKIELADSAGFMSWNSTFAAFSLSVGKHRNLQQIVG